METSQSVVPRNDELTAQQVAVHYDRGRLQEMMLLADKFFKAKCFGADVQNAEQALVKMQAGFEMGMPPMEAMNSLYIVNGHVGIWGAAQSKRLTTKGWQISYKESPENSAKPEVCTVTITKGDVAHSHTVKATDLQNSRAIKFAQLEKMRYHCLSRLIRFNVPEVLEAGVQYLVEELQDMPEEPKDPTVVPALLAELETAQDMTQWEAVKKKLAEAYNKNLLTPEELDRATEAFVNKKKSLTAQQNPPRIPVLPPKEITPEKKEDLNNLATALNPPKKLKAKKGKEIPEYPLDKAGNSKPL